MNGTLSQSLSQQAIHDVGGAGVATPAPPAGVADRLTLILPVYREAGVVDRTMDAVLQFASVRSDYRFVFVDDGSDDGTGDVLQSRVEAVGDPRVALVRCPRHRGKGAAIRSALDRCRTEFICFTDGDLAYSLDQVALLERALQSCDVAIGSRLLDSTAADRPLLRRASGWAFNGLVRLILGLPYRDTQAGLKGFRSQAARRLFSLQSLDGFGFDAELLFLARKLGLSVAEVPARVSPTHSYKTACPKLLRNSLEMLRDVFQIRRNDAGRRYPAEDPAQLRR